MERREITGLLQFHCKYSIPFEICLFLLYFFIYFFCFAEPDDVMVVFSYSLLILCQIKNRKDAVILEKSLFVSIVYFENILLHHAFQ